MAWEGVQSCALSLSVKAYQRCWSFCQRSSFCIFGILPTHCPSWCNISRQRTLIQTWLSYDGFMGTQSRSSLPLIGPLISHEHGTSVLFLLEAGSSQSRQRDFCSVLSRLGTGKRARESWEVRDGNFPVANHNWNHCNALPVPSIPMERCLPSVTWCPGTWRLGRYISCCYYIQYQNQYLLLRWMCICPFQRTPDRATCWC